MITHHIIHSIHCYAIGAVPVRLCHVYLHRFPAVGRRCETARMRNAQQRVGEVQESRQCSRVVRVRQVCVVCVRCACGTSVCRCVRGAEVCAAFARLSTIIDICYAPDVCARYAQHVILIASDVVKKAMLAGRLPSSLCFSFFRLPLFDVRLLSFFFFLLRRICYHVRERAR